MDVFIFNDHQVQRWDPTDWFITVVLGREVTLMY